MNKEETVRKNLDLLDEFMKYAFEHPQVLDQIPSGAELVILRCAGASRSGRAGRWGCGGSTVAAGRGLAARALCQRPGWVYDIDDLLDRQDREILEGKP